MDFLGTNQKFPAKTPTLMDVNRNVEFRLLRTVVD